MGIVLFSSLRSTAVKILVCLQVHLLKTRGLLHRNSCALAAWRACSEEADVSKKTGHHSFIALAKSSIHAALHELLRVPPSRQQAHERLALTSLNTNTACTRTVDKQAPYLRKL